MRFSAFMVNSRAAEEVIRNVISRLFFVPKENLTCHVRSQDRRLSTGAGTFGNWAADFEAQLNRDAARTFAIALRAAVNNPGGLDAFIAQFRQLLLDSGAIQEPFTFLGMDLQSFVIEPTADSCGKNYCSGSNLKIRASEPVDICAYAMTCAEAEAQCCDVVEQKITYMSIMVMTFGSCCGVWALLTGCALCRWWRQRRTVPHLKTRLDESANAVARIVWELDQRSLQVSLVGAKPGKVSHKIVPRSETEPTSEEPSTSSSADPDADSKSDSKASHAEASERIEFVPLFPHNTLVEYYSRTLNMWLHGRIQLKVGRVTPKECRVEYDVLAHAGAHRLQLRQDVGANCMRAPMRRGEAVEVFHPRQGRWTPGIMQRDSGRYSFRNYTVFLQERGEEATVPRQQVRRRFDHGTHVLVYKGLHGGWVPAVVDRESEEAVQAQDLIANTDLMTKTVEQTPRSRTGGLDTEAGGDNNTGKPPERLDSTMSTSTMVIPFWKLVPVRLQHDRGNLELVPSYFIMPDHIGDLADVEPETGDITIFGIEDVEVLMAQI